MAVNVKALVSVSGKIEVSFPDGTTLASAGALIPEELADLVKVKIQTIPGVSAADVRCGILDLMEVTT